MCGLKACLGYLSSWVIQSVLVVARRSLRSEMWTCDGPGFLSRERSGTTRMVSVTGGWVGLATLRCGPPCLQCFGVNLFSSAAFCSVPFLLFHSVVWSCSVLLCCAALDCCCWRSLACGGWPWPVGGQVPAWPRPGICLDIWSGGGGQAIVCRVARVWRDRNT